MDEEALAKSWQSKKHPGRSGLYGIRQIMDAKKKSGQGRIFQPGQEVSDVLFGLLRDQPNLSQQKHFIEDLWKRYKPYADGNFVSECPRQFLQRFWEMYLACSLLESELKLTPKGTPTGKGPDLCVARNGPKIWIEAIAPTRGAGPDAVPQITSGAYYVREEGIILRFRSAIEEKYRKYKKYLTDGLIQPGEPYIIAINGAGVPDADAVFSDEIPYPVQAVLPFGPGYVTVDRESLEIVDQGFAYRGRIYKLSKGPVSTSVFLDPTYAQISGLIFSNVDPLRTTTIIEGSLSFLHNPVAASTLPLGWLVESQEWWLDGKELKNRVVAKK